MNFKGVFDKFKNALYPENETCDVCGGELAFESRYNLCSKCAEELEFNDGKICLTCGTPIYNEADYCLRCSKEINLFKLNRSPLVYEGLAKKTVLGFKYGEKRYLAKFLAKLMTDEFIKQNLSADVIEFVPMTKKEKRKRGYNQAELLAIEVGANLKIELSRSLEKIKETPEQKKLTAKERAENLKSVFGISSQAVKGKDVLLIDDIFTTGATANECTKQLLKAGAKSVTVLTAAVTSLKPYMV